MIAHLAARLRRGLPVFVAATALLIACRPASAGLVISATSVPAAQPSTGNTFDVTLTNTAGSAPVSVGTFVFEVTLANAQVNMTNATGLTDSSYIFFGNSLDEHSGAPLLLSTTGQDLTAVDTAQAGGTTVNPGASFLLGHVSFNVGSPTAAGPVTVHISTEAQGGSSLSDVNGGNLDFTTQDGTITVGRAVNVVPEPASLVLCAVGGGSLLLAGWRRRSSRAMSV
jgi:hypothetical protein